MKRYILVIDEGTTGVRALLFNREMKILETAYEKLDLFYPGPEEVELDALSVYDKMVKVCRQVVAKHEIKPEEIQCVGMTSQRATWLFWDKTTGKPLRNAVTWMDGRGIYQKQKLVEEPLFNEKFPGVAPNLPGVWMPLIFDKIRDEEPEFAKAVIGENVLFGHIDSFLGWKLTKGTVHATTYGAASASGIYISPLKTWNLPILEYFNIGEKMLPGVREESGDFGMMDEAVLGVGIPIYSSFADQQAALFSQGCLEKNTIKCTLGTGSFVDINTDDEFKEAPGLNGGISWKIGGKLQYLLEGMSYTAGACLEWAKNEFHLFDEFKEMEEMASRVENSGGVYFVPALAGIWGDESAKGAYMGIRPSVTNAHMMRATLEGVAFGTLSLIETALGEHAIGDVREIKISGGASKSDTIAQTMANVTGARVVRPESVEATALGAAEAAAIQAGWIDISSVKQYLCIDRIYVPDGRQKVQKEQYENWKKAVARTLRWDA